MKDKSKKNGLIGAILFVSGPTRHRTVKGLSRDNTLKNDCPKKLVSGEKVIIIPTKNQLLEYGDLDYKAKDDSVSDAAKNHPAFLCSDALHKIEALKSQVYRDLKSLSISTPYSQGVFPESEEQQFLDKCEVIKKEFSEARDQFFVHYPALIKFWGEVSAKKWGDKWGDIVMIHAPKLLDIARNFHFVGETHDIGLRSTNVDEDSYVGYLFSDLVDSVEKWHSNLGKSGEDILVLKGDVTKLNNEIGPKLERYEFLDKRVKAISTIVSQGIENTLSNLANKSVCPEGKLNGQCLKDFYSLINLLKSNHSLHAIQSANIKVMTPSKVNQEVQIKETASKKVKLPEKKEQLSLVENTTVNYFQEQLRSSI